MLRPHGTGPSLSAKRIGWRVMVASPSGFFSRLPQCRQSGSEPESAAREHRQQPRLSHTALPHPRRGAGIPARHRPRSLKVPVVRRGGAITERPRGDARDRPLIDRCATWSPLLARRGGRVRATTNVIHVRVEVTHIGGNAKRKLEAMGRVRPELMRVVYSRLTDEEATERIGELVRSDPRAAEATLRYVRRPRDYSRAYDTDRAYRILVGAMNGTAPEPARRDDLELFERERELGWLPRARRLSDSARLSPSSGVFELGPRNWPSLRNRSGLSTTRSEAAL